MPRIPAPRTMLLGALFLSAAAVHSIRVPAPFTHYHENVTACYANFGRNYARFGYARSGFLPVWAVAPEDPGGRFDRRLLYSQRPPIVSLFVSLSCRIFGPTEPAVRLVGLLGTMATLAAFLALAVRLLGATWGSVAAALLAFTPDFAFFGPAIAHQTFGLLGALLIVLSYLRWRERPDRRRLAELAAVTVLCCWLDWPAFYGAGAAALLQLTSDRTRWRVALVPLASAAAALGLFVLYLFLIDSQDGTLLDYLARAGRVHSGGAPLDAYLSVHASKAVRWFTIPLLTLAALGVSRLRPRKSFEDASLLATALLASDLVLFREMTFSHPFLSVPAAPFLALAAARGLQFLSLKRWTQAVAAVLAVAFVGQAAQTLWRGHSGGHFPYYAQISRALGLALRQATAPGERSLVRLIHDPHITGFYADRPMAAFASRAGTLERYDARTLERGIDETAILALLERPGHGFSWFVTTSAGLRPLPDRVADPDAFGRSAYDFESEREPSRLVAALRARYREERRDGFLFFDLRR